MASLLVQEDIIRTKYWRKKLFDMIVSQTGGRTINVRWRNPETLERQEQIISEYPYCFVDNKPTDTYNITLDDKEYEGVYGEKLTKVLFRTDYDRSEWVKSHRGLTWEASMPFTNQVLNDRILKGEEPFPNYEHRVWYLDGEWKQESGEITILSVLDSYTGKTYTWLTHPEVKAGLVNSIPCKNHPDGLQEVVFDPPAKAFANERQLLADFSAHMKKQDPDIIAGWYVVDADIYQICTRMRRNGLKPESLSPVNKHIYKYNWSDKRWNQPIVARICFDLMVGFKKLWTIKNGQLAGQKLDEIAEFVLGERKIPLKDGHDTYYTDIGTYVDYNRQDVRLLPKLDEEVNAIGYFTSLQHLVQCEIETTPLTTLPASCLFIQDEDFDLRIPDRPKFAHVDYTGADVQEVEAGIYHNMAIMDIKAMYHSNVKLHNISWDTIDENGVDCGNGTKFTKDRSGLLGRAMDKLTVKRNEYKALMKQALADGDMKAYKKYDGSQFATKSMVASLYGVAGDSKYGMYHPDIASAITYTSRQTLYRLRDECNSRGYPVRYGHTDSIFCEVPTAEEGLELVAEINKAMHPIETEFEKWCESMILKAKNRYAGKVTWTDGNYHEPDYYYKGLELKQARMPKAMKQSMDSILRAILDGKNQNEIDDLVCSLIKQGVNGDMGEDLLMIGKLKRPLSSYKTISGATAGVVWAKKHLNRSYQVDEAFLTAVNKNGDFMAFDSLDSLNGIDEVDWSEMTERFIVKKACDIYELVNWDSQILWNAHRGVREIEWI